MAYSLLGNASKTNLAAPTVRIEGTGAPGALQRLGQWLAGLLWSQILVCFGAVTVMLLAAASGGPEGKIQETRATLLGLSLLIVPLASIYLAVIVALRGVYLAQLVGVAVGGSAGLIVLGERIYFELAPAWYDWLFLPVLGAGIGFVAGLRVAGQLVVRAAFEYKPIDSWDRTARPSVRELDPRAQTRWNRLLFGLAVGIFASYVVPILVAYALKPLYGNEANTRSTLYRLQLPMEMAALLFAGIAAGSGTKSGAAQGFLAGAGIFALRALFSGVQVDWPIDLTICLVSATIGGLLGRWIFRPTQLYGNALGR